MALTIAVLKAICAPLAGDLAARGVAEAELAKIRPRGEDNPARDVHAWLRYYGSLRVRRALAERDTPAESGAAAAADRVILEALAGAAKSITLSASEGTVRELAAYPKSAFTLIHCHERNLAIAQLLASTSRLGQSEDPETRDVVTRALREAVHQHRVLAWIACTPGPGLPFPERTRDPDLPPAFATLAPQDLIAICSVFHDVNWARLSALEAIVTPDPEADDEPRRRPTWSQFFGALTASEGGPSEHVLRDRSLAGLMATTQLAGSAQRQAMADAKARATPEVD